MFSTKIKQPTYQYKLHQIFIIFLVISLSNEQKCPPKESDLKLIKNYLKSKFNEVKRFKPGINPKDVEWAIYKVMKEVSTHNKFAPCNNGFLWPQIEEDANQIKISCYKPSDLTQSKAQNEIRECAKKFHPQFFLRYGKQAIDSCICFEKHILPNWEKRYQKYATDYVEEFKTLRHRKQNIAKIRGLS